MKEYGTNQTNVTCLLPSSLLQAVSASCLNFLNCTTKTYVSRSWDSKSFSGTSCQNQSKSLNPPLRIFEPRRGFRSSSNFRTPDMIFIWWYHLIWWFVRRRINSEFRATSHIRYIYRMVGMIQEVFRRILHKYNRNFLNCVSNSNMVPYTQKLSTKNHMSIDLLIFLFIFNNNIKSLNNFRSHLCYPKGKVWWALPQWKWSALNQKELIPQKAPWSPTHSSPYQDVKR